MRIQLVDTPDGPKLINVDTGSEVQATMPFDVAYERFSKIRDSIESVIAELADLTYLDADQLCQVREYLADLAQQTCPDPPTVESN